MSFHNGLTAPGVKVATTGVGDWVALQFIAASDVTFTDSLGNVSALTAVPAGTRLDVSIVSITSIGTAGAILGYLRR